MSKVIQDKAPHGGTWIQSEIGFVEISVFETGVPPHFRLYFFDGDTRSLPPSAIATLETVRPGGERQVFEFIQEKYYLRSTSDIPEPHEFNVSLILTGADGARTYITKFTEEAHGHSHVGHGHSHGQDEHSHAHGSGLLGWLRGTFGHSHSIEDKIDETMETNARGIWALKISLVGLLVTSLIHSPYAAEQLRG